MAEFVKVAKTGEIAPGEARAVEAGGKKIALFNVNGTFYAIDDTCTHRGGPLSEGMLMGEEVTCPWHGAIFDVTSGTVLGALAPRDVGAHAGWFAHRVILLQNLRSTAAAETRRNPAESTTHQFRIAYCLRSSQLRNRPLL